MCPAPPLPLSLPCPRAPIREEEVEVFQRLREEEALLLRVLIGDHPPDVSEAREASGGFTVAVE